MVDIGGEASLSNGRRAGKGKPVPIGRVDHVIFFRRCMCKSSLASLIKANFDGVRLGILQQLADRLLILSSHIGFS